MKESVHCVDTRHLDTKKETSKIPVFFWAAMKETEKKKKIGAVVYSQTQTKDKTGGWIFLVVFYFMIIIILGRRARAKFCETLPTFFLVFEYVSYRMIWRLRLGIVGIVGICSLPPLPSPGCDDE